MIFKFGLEVLSRHHLAKTLSRKKDLKNNWNNRKHDIRCLVAFGGNWSFNGANDVCSAGRKAIAFPGTIDNDLAYIDITYRYGLACQNTIDAILKIKKAMDTRDGNYWRSYG